VCIDTFEPRQSILGFGVEDIFGDEFAVFPLIKKAELDI
jgi:hypothetical protein